MLCLVLNDRQKVAFRIPAFITENVDDAVLLSNFQTVTVQSSLHRHRLGIATITFKLTSANLLGIGVVVVVGGQTTEPVRSCICLSATTECIPMQGLDLDLLFAVFQTV